MKPRPESLLLIFCSALAGIVLAVLFQQFDLFGRSSAEVSSPAIDPVLPSLEEDAEQLGLQIQIAVARRSASSCMALSSSKMFAERANKHQQEIGHSLSIETSLAREHLLRLWDRFCERDARYQIRFESMGVRTFRGELAICFRLVSRDDLIDYYFVVVKRNDKGEAKATDAYSFSRGYWHSHLWHQAYLQAERSGDFDGFKQAKSYFLGLLQSAADFGARQNWGAVHELLEREVPAVLISNPPTAYLRWMAAYMGGRQLFLKVAPDVVPILAPTSSLIVRFLLHQEREEVEEAFKLLDEIDEQVGGDSYLNFYRGRILLKTKRHAEGVEILEKVVADYPESWGIYAALIDYWGARQEARKLSAVLLRAEREFVFDFDVVAADPKFAWFLKSHHYKDFTQQREEILRPRREYMDSRVRMIVSRDNVKNRR